MDIEEDNNWGNLPDEVIAYAKESLEQIEAGKGIPHEEVRESYQKWLPESGSQFPLQGFICTFE
jgi:hypothetical protein